MKWLFNKEVADNFDYIADTSIPKYRIILYKTLEIIKDFPKDSKILEIGCANGNTLELLRNAGFTNVVGVDNSPAMIKKCEEKNMNVFLTDDFPKSLGAFDIVLANWTLHFITDISKRIKYLDDISDSLVPNGKFILSEKVSGDLSTYHDFKRNNFLSEADILEKTESLRNILVTLDEDFYLNLFSDMNYSKIEIIDKTFCFRTFELTK